MFAIPAGQSWCMLVRSVLLLLRPAVRPPDQGKPSGSLLLRGALMLKPRRHGV